MEEPLKFDFGKHCGKRINEVPVTYLLWLSEQNWLKEAKPEVFHYIKTHKSDLRRLSRYAGRVCNHCLLKKWRLQAKLDDDTPHGLKSSGF